jgi:N-acyl homoserine lactone hydrolase
MSCSIKPLYFGYFKDFDKSRFTMTMDIGVYLDVAILAYLVQTNDGKIVLVDSGTPSPELMKHMDNREIFDHRDMIDVLADEGLAPDDISDIILTHLHWDHAFNLNYFPNAGIYVQKSELQYAVDPLWIHKAPYGYSKKNGNPCWFDGFMQMTVKDGDWVYNEDISVYHLPGHTPGMQGVLVNTKEGKYMIASDNIPLYDCFDYIKPPVVHVSVDDWYKSYLRIKELADYVLPGHDMKVLDRKVYGE